MVSFASKAIQKILQIADEIEVAVCQSWLCSINYLLYIIEAYCEKEEKGSMEISDNINNKEFYFCLLSS